MTLNEGLPQLSKFKAQEADRQAKGKNSKISQM